VGVRGDEILRLRVEVSKIASPAAGNDDLAADLGVVLDDDRSAAAFTGLDGAKKPRSAPADDGDVKLHR
jgi:hypothetical protein